MYLPAHFEERRPEVLHAMIRNQPLGLLITLADSGLCADPIPLMLDGGDGAGLGTLRGHVARANPLWRATRTETEALVVFQGPQAYVSPAFYPSKAEHGKVVPTWNYCVVQARGTLRAIDDAAWLHALVTRLTDRHEAPRKAAREAPWAVSDAPPAYIDTMLRAIVGIEITLTALTGKWKVSQNRSAADRDGVARGLRLKAETDSDANAATMARLVEGVSIPDTETPRHQEPQGKKP